MVYLIIIYISGVVFNLGLWVRECWREQEIVLPEEPKEWGIALGALFSSVGIWIVLLIGIILDQFMDHKKIQNFIDKNQFFIHEYFENKNEKDFYLIKKSLYQEIGTGTVNKKLYYPFNIFKVKIGGYKLKIIYRGIGYISDIQKL